MTRQILLLSFLFTISINKSIYAQNKFVNWPDKNIRNQLRDFTDLYKQLDTIVSFEDFQYPLNASAAVKEMFSSIKQINPNDPLLLEATPEAMKEAEKEMDFITCLRTGFVSIVRQRVILEQYRFAHLNSAMFKTSTSKLETSLDSIRWHLYKYNDHPRTKTQIKKIEDMWVKKTCCNYFKWYGDFLTHQKIFNDLESITNQFRRLWDIEYDVEDSDFEKDHMPKHSYAQPASYYLVDNNNTEVSYVDMATDVEMCRNELKKLSTALKGKIADTTNIARTYSQNKERWLLSLEHLQDSLTSSKTILEDSIRLLKRKQNLYKKQADSIVVAFSNKRKVKDSLTILIKTVTEKLTDSTSQELFLNKLRRQYVAERDTIYKKCGDPNCKDSAIIAELKVVNEKINRANDKLDVIGKNIDDLQKKKRNLTKSFVECTTLLKQVKQADIEISQKLTQATSAYDTNEKAFYPIITECNDNLEWVVSLSEMSKFFFALNYDK